MAWTSLSFSFGSLLTSTKMTQMYDNFDAVMAKASGAPTLASSYVVRSMLSTTQQSINHSVNTGNSQNFSFSSTGTYGFQLYVSSAPANITNEVSVGGGSYTVTRIAAGNSGAHVLVMRYITSSPPWDLGDGDIQNFVWLLLDGIGNIVSSVSCIDPPWNFLTQQRALRKGLLTVTVDEADRDPEKRAELDRELDNIERIEPTQLNMSEKIADMPVFPHPWADGNRDTTGLTIAMLDPVSPLMERFKKLDQLGMEDGEDVLNLLNNDYIRFDNTPLTRALPPGVIAIEPRWKWTPAPARV